MGQPCLSIGRYLGGAFAWVVLLIQVSPGEESPGPPPTVPSSRAEADRRRAEYEPATVPSSRAEADRQRAEYERALANVRAVFGDRHPLYARNLNYLAGLLWTQGDYAAAKPLFQQALDIRKVALGERHPATATSLNNLALLLEEQGDHAAAKPL